MNARALVVIAIMAAVTFGGLAYVAHQMWDTEPELVSGPLVAALSQARSPGDRRTNLDEIFDEYVDNGLPAEDRIPILEAEGFACSVRQMDDDNTVLDCSRPLEGTWFCEGFLYFVYELSSGEIFQRSGTDYFVESPQRNGRDRCPNNDPRGR